MKKIRIIIITLVIVLALGCATFATLYFATDVFKSEKEMFYKYISKININQITDTNSYNNYQTRLESKAYTNNGAISIKVQEDGETAFDESFKFNSQVDPVNKLASSTIDINKDGEKALTVNYLRNEDLYGLKFKDIVNQYVVFENNNLKEFVAKFGVVDTTNIPDKIDLSEMLQNVNQEEVSLEELKSIGNKYVNIIIEEVKKLPEKNFSKVEDGYKLTIDLKTFQNICLEILDTLKDDEQVFNLINSLISTIKSEINNSGELISEQNMQSLQELSFTQYQEIFEQIIQQLSTEIEENYEIINIVVYKQEKIYVKIGIDSDEGKSYIDGTIEKNDNKLVLKLNNVNEISYKNIETNFMISKNLNTTENDEYNLNIISKQDGEEFVNANIMVARNGKLDSNNIKNSFAATIMVPEQNLEISMKCNNDKTFDSNIEIEKFNDSNHEVINKYDYTQMSTLITNLDNLISEETNLNIVEILGATGIGILSTSSMNLQSTAMIGLMLTGINISVSLNGELFETAKNAAEEAQNNVESQEIEMFNMQFEVYGGLQSGTNVKMLKTTILSSNSRDPEHSIGYTNVDIDSNKTYNISFKKDSEGYINMVIIEEQ